MLLKAFSNVSQLFISQNAIEFVYSLKIILVKISARINFFAKLTTILVYYSLQLQ